MDNTKILLLDRFMRGETSPEEEQQLLAWFREVDSQEDILTFYRQRWHESATKEISEEVQLRMFNQIRDRINTDKTVLQKNDRKQNRRRLLRWGQYAAAVILCVVVGITSHLYTRQSMAEVKEYMVEAEKGQRASVTLPDGTKVWLNSHTQIIYNSNYGVEDRVVDLRGEAYFEVAKDKEHRFIVKAGGLDVEALGTTFNVKAYKDDQTIDVSLVSGKVNVRLDDEMEHKGEVELHPNRMLRYNKETDRVEMKEIEGRDAYDWTNGTLRFEEKTFAEIAKDLERKYDLHIHIVSDKLKKEVFTGSFSGYYTLDDVLREVDVEHKYTWKQTANELVIRDK